MFSVSGKVNHINTLIAWLYTYLPPTVATILENQRKIWIKLYTNLGITNPDPNNKDTKSEILFGTMEKVSSNVIRIGLHVSGSDNSDESGSTNDSSRILAFSWKDNKLKDESKEQNKDKQQIYNF
ncbi:hypothetical protein F8M41_003475 [Gigaspora margarita]|uniref:Uncharacterized protein n=1 Tax=Gigaspora margarita TaxID=4874 RepID=A0A8H4A7G0_GIGMA|nr:hypothetical protein F8M41_003475 [Gigaspora margarita]